MTNNDEHSDDEQGVLEPRVLSQPTSSSCCSKRSLGNARQGIGGEPNDRSFRFTAYAVGCCGSWIGNSPFDFVILVITGTVPMVVLK